MSIGYLPMRVENEYFLKSAMRMEILAGFSIGYGAHCAL